MKVLITGGAGQVGSAVADILLARGDQVLSLDNFATGRRDNLLDQPNLTQIEGSIANHGLLDRLFAEFKPDVVVHTAASYKDPDDWQTDALVNAVAGEIKHVRDSQPAAGGAPRTVIGMVSAARAFIG